jgi:transposase
VKEKFTQRQLLTYTANMQTSLIGSEACSGALFLGRALRKQGHDVRLIAAQFVKPFVKSNKNDFVDAEAIAEAVERKNMRFVPIKTDDQLDLQAIHRVRDRLISRRTAVINQLRAFLLERGMVFAQTPAKLKAAMADILENAEADLTPQMRNLIDMLWSRWKMVEQQIKEVSDELERTSAADAGCTGYARSPASGRSSPPPSLRLSATALPFVRVESSLHGSASFPASTQLAARQSCSVSASAATSTCVRF